MCGWRRDICDVIDLLDTMVIDGSELHLLNQVDPDTRIQRFHESGLEEHTLKHLRIIHQQGNPSFRKHLERLELESYTSVLILADEALESDSMHSDSASLACLLLVRHIQVRVAVAGLAAGCWLTVQLTQASRKNDAEGDKQSTSVSDRLLNAAVVSGASSGMYNRGGRSPNASSTDSLINAMLNEDAKEAPLAGGSDTMARRVQVRRRTVMMCARARARVCVRECVCVGW